MSKIRPLADRVLCVEDKFAPDSVLYGANGERMTSTSGVRLKVLAVGSGVKEDIEVDQRVYVAHERFFRAIRVRTVDDTGYVLLHENDIDAVLL